MQLPMVDTRPQLSASVGKNSVDKIITTYFASITRKWFYFKGKMYDAKPLHISPLIFRHYTCPSGCGACCQRYELVYLPHEPRPDDEHTVPTDVYFDGK